MSCLLITKPLLRATESAQSAGRQLYHRYANWDRNWQVSRLHDTSKKKNVVSKQRASGAEPKTLSMKKNMLWNSVGSFVRTACYWLLTVVVVRFSDDFNAAGALALAMSIVNLFSPIADFKLRAYAITDVTSERSASKYIGIRLVTTLVTFLASLVYVVVTCNLKLFWILAIYIASQLVYTFGDGYHAVHQRAMRMDYVGISYGLQGVLSLAFFTVSMWQSGSLLIAVSSLLLAAIGITFLYDFPTARALEAVNPRIDWRDLSHLLLKMTPLVLVAIMLNAVGLFPRQYLAARFSESALGIYSAVAAPVIVVQISASYITYPLLGRMAELFRSNRKLAKKIQRQVIFAILVIAALSSILFFVVGEDILALIFGDSIRPYTYLIQPALLLSFITAIAWYFNDLLFTLRDFKGCLVGSIVAALVTVLLTWPLTPVFEMNAPSVIGILAYIAALAVWGIFYMKDFRALETKEEYSS